MFKKMKILSGALAVFAVGVHSVPAQSAQDSVAVVEAKMAPSFSATDIYGKAFDLDSQRGKIVVLEWTNHDCPFVKKHYSTNNMQKAQKMATDQDVVWVTIVSSAPEKQGSVTPEEAKAIIKEKKSHETTRILDPSGEIGHLYGAVTTPHMFVIDTEGHVAYEGAIDDNPSPSPEAVEGAENYVLAAIEDLQTGVPVQTAQTRPYGCSVKY